MHNHKVSRRVKRQIKEIIHNLKRTNHLQQKIIGKLNEEVKELKKEKQANSNES